jgi:hypothetical protein
MTYLERLKAVLAENAPIRGTDKTDKSPTQFEIARPNNRGVRLAEIGSDAACAVQNVQKVRLPRTFGQIEQPPITLPKPLKAAVQRWVNDRFTPSPPGVCIHCGEGARADDLFVLLFVASDRADVHSSCHAAWRAEREAEAEMALDLMESA